MTNQGNQQAAREFAVAFADTLADSLTRAAGRAWQIKILAEPDLSAQQGQAIHFQIALEGALRGSFFVELYQQQVRELVSKISGEVVSAFDEADGNALEEVLAAAATALAAKLSPQRGAFTCTVQHVSGLAFGGMLLMPLSALEEEQPGISVTLYFDGQLLSALGAEAPAQGAAAKSKSALDALNLNLVMDVELNVSLRFGQRQLPLHEELELVSGSVVELDRQVDDPVELLLDGKVIARGEAVIVDGNYGLRVTEIPQPIASHLAR
jgi:flagellar motor switch protein FliN/FliY